MHSEHPLIEPIKNENVGPARDIFTIDPDVGAGGKLNISRRFFPRERDVAELQFLGGKKRLKINSQQQQAAEEASRACQSLPHVSRGDR